MDCFDFLNFLVGPLGRSFGVIKERGQLFSEGSFMELPPKVLERFNQLCHRQEEKMFSIGFLEDEKLIEVATELDKISLIRASEMIKEAVMKMDPDLCDEKEIIEKFASEYKCLTDIKTDPEIYR